MSLREALRKELETYGYISVNKAYEIAEAHKNKQSNAERRLRKSEMPDVEPVQKKGANVGYRLIKKEQNENQTIRANDSRDRLEDTKVSQSPLLKVEYTS